MAGKKVVVEYSKIVVIDAVDLVGRFGGFFDGDVGCVVFPFGDEVVEELENRGIEFRVEEVI